MVMVAIRGTQLGGTLLEEQNDICADWWLMDREDPGYEFCDKFTVDQMNYFQQLVEFSHEVRVISELDAIGKNRETILAMHF